MARHANATKRLSAAALLCDILGFCFTLVGTFGPAWLVFEDGLHLWSLQEGIWLAKYCRNMTCKVSSREHILTEIGRDKFVSVLGDKHWTEFKVLSVLAITSSLVAVSATTIVLVKKSRNYHVPLLMIGGVSAFSSCIFLLVPVLKTTVADSSSKYSGAWTKIVASVGVFLQFSATIIQVFAVYQSMRHCCAIKQYERYRRQRVELVVRYLCTQGATCHSNVSGNPNLQSVTTTSGQSMTVNSTTSGQSRTVNSDSGVSSVSGLPPYAIVSELPSFSEITASFSSNNFHNNNRI